MTRSVSILDCTLRDGSYAVHQQFTACDTARICEALEGAGLEQIEIGHGVGLGASGSRFGLSAATDEEYIAAAAKALQKARFGAFYIPGIGSTDHLDMAREHGMHFVRIGTNVHQYRETRHHIEHARHIGLDVSYNAMKSYLATPVELLEVMRETVAWGAQATYVVDSAGSLIPPEVKAYVGPLVGELGVPVGFHGHNNLMLANANCLAAWEAGARLFDATLQGLGRSGGNAQTEILALIFEKMNIATGLDMAALFDAGDKLIRPILGVDGGGATPLNIVIGMAGFHSSYLGRVNSAAERYGIDVKELILAVCQHDRVDPSPELIDRVANELVRRTTRERGSSRVPRFDRKDWIRLVSS